MKKSPVFDENTAFYEENERFRGLIRHYARKLSDPHAEGDLWGFLCIVKILTENKMPHEYYCGCLRYEYIRLYKVDKLLRNTDELTEESVTTDFDVDSIDTRLDLAECSRNLTEAELRAVRLQYGFGYKVEECATLLNVSRQAVWKNRCRAFKKMREALTR